MQLPESLTGKTFAGTFLHTLHNLNSWLQMTFIPYSLANVVEDEGAQGGQGRGRVGRPDAYKTSQWPSATGTH